MSSRVKHIMLFAGLAVMAVMMIAALPGLPAFGDYPGPYGLLINQLAPAQRHVTNAITAINFDYRGLDTLGEEFILFAAVTGVTLLLRSETHEDGESGEQETAEGRPDLPRSDLAAITGGPSLALLVLFGIYVALHAALTPGGGFQGGAILGSACVLVYLTRSYQAFRGTVPKTPTDVAEAVGAAAYGLIGVAALASGAAFLQNVLPLGTTGTLASSGTIIVINMAVALEVAAGFAVLVLEFVQEIRRLPPRANQRNPTH